MGFTQALLRLASGLGTGLGHKSDAAADTGIKAYAAPGGLRPQEACGPRNPWPANDAKTFASSQSFAFSPVPQAFGLGRRHGRCKRPHPAADDMHNGAPGSRAHGDAGSRPMALRIVQHHPGEHPECLFISGRMADVCAALERMVD